MFTTLAACLPRAHVAVRGTGSLHGAAVLAARQFSKTAGVAAALPRAPASGQRPDTDSRWGDLFPIQRMAKPEKKRTADDIWAEMHDRNFKTLPPVADPWDGRRIHVQNGNVSQALASLNRRLNQNNVLRTSVYQRRHEKRGYRLRRLKSEKWRRMFAHEVRQKVALVQKIRKRGG